MDIQENIFMGSAGGGDVIAVCMTNAPRIRLDDGRYNPTAYERLLQHAEQFNISESDLCVMQAASNTDSPGFREIISWENTQPETMALADGVILTQTGTVVGFQTADCLSVVAINTKNGKTTVYHCGRPAGMIKGGSNIITDALAQICEPGEEKFIDILAFGNICGECFEHLDGPARAQADVYLETLGPKVFNDVGRRALNMRAVLKVVHIDAGILANQIRFMGLDCTREAPCCASHREHLIKGEVRTVANTTLVLKKR